MGAVVAAPLLPEASIDWLLACCAFEDGLELTSVLAPELEPEAVLAFEFEPELGSELVLELVLELELDSELDPELVPELGSELDPELDPGFAPELDPEFASEVVPEFAPEPPFEGTASVGRSPEGGTLFSEEGSVAGTVVDSEPLLFDPSPLP